MGCELSRAVNFLELVHEHPPYLVEGNFLHFLASGETYRGQPPVTARSTDIKALKLARCYQSCGEGSPIWRVIHRGCLQPVWVESAW